MVVGAAVGSESKVDVTADEFKKTLVFKAHLSHSLVRLLPCPMGSVGSCFFLV